MSTAVEVVNVSKSFAANTAVNNINLTIEKGEFFSFLGPSGCGKTTLLRMIAGFETPTEGRISIAGADMKGVPPHKRPVNMVFQNYALFPHLTIAENIAFGLKSARKYTVAEISERVKSALELVRLAQFTDRLPSQISGGQQQRAALARAIVNDPSVLLLDEPLSALDPQIREEMQFEMASLQQRLGITFVMVTHDQNEALALSNRIAVFRQGHLEQVASPAKIYNQPETLFVARFVGQTNAIAGKIIGTKGGGYMVAADGLEIVAISQGANYSTGEQVILLVKPHEINLLEGMKGTHSDENIYKAQVLNKSFQGTTTEYLLQLDNKTELRASKSNNLQAAADQNQTEAVIQIPPTAIVILPIESNEAY